jgi:outer membrane protein OmpA-like peptidoglycan-associated protein
MAGQGGMAGAGLAGQGATALTQTADAKAKAEAEKQAADAKAKAEAEKQAADAKAKAEAEKQAADTKAKADAEKQAAAKAKEEETKVTIETAPPAAGAPVDDIGPAKLHFPTGSANPQLANETKAYFQKVASYLKAHPQTRITVVGHTDSQGAAAKNEKLGLERAETTKKLLVGNGIPADRLEVSSKGASEPIADNKTDAGRKKNRRVEITPIK